MVIDIITLFPQSFESFLNYSIIKRAQDKDLAKVNLINLRDFGIGSYQQVDDTPYGGGAGMVIRADVATRALQKVISGQDKKAKIINLSPRGQLLNQRLASELAEETHLVLFNSHYEGVDQRFVDKYVNLEVSIGDYVLSGGELASMVLVDSVTRLIPNVLGNLQSNQEESFSIASSQSLLEYPHYTKPAEFESLKVPPVLLSGDHAKIKQWRFEQSQIITEKRRPDLLKKG